MLQLDTLASDEVPMPDILRFSPPHTLPGRRRDTYICHLCGEEEDRYQSRQQADGNMKRVDVSGDPCRNCLKSHANIHVEHEGTLETVIDMDEIDQLRNFISVRM